MLTYFIYSFSSLPKRLTDPESKKVQTHNPGADPGFFLGGGALVSCSTSTPINHIVSFCRIPVLLENRRSSRGGGGAHPLHPPPRSAPDNGGGDGDGDRKDEKQ